MRGATWMEDGCPSAGISIETAKQTTGNEKELNIFCFGYRSLLSFKAIFGTGERNA